MSLEPFKTHTGLSAALLMDNIDTDQIIPSREMKSVTKTGLSDGLFAGQRYIEGRKPNPDFVLNQIKGATILLSGKNFGCGSSREHAVWALAEYGFKAVIAQSFGEIFYNNCIRNGILPIVLAKTEIAKLSGQLSIDLEAQTVNDIWFDIASGDKDMLLNGRDAIAATLEYEDEISAFLAADKTSRPWIYER